MHHPNITRTDAVALWVVRALRGLVLVCVGGLGFCRRRGPVGGWRVLFSVSLHAGVPLLVGARSGDASGIRWVPVLPVSFTLKWTWPNCP